MNGKRLLVRMLLVASVVILATFPYIAGAGTGHGG